MLQKLPHSFVGFQRRVNPLSDFQKLLFSFFELLVLEDARDFDFSNLFRNFLIKFDSVDADENRFEVDCRLDVNRGRDHSLVQVHGLKHFAQLVDRRVWLVDPLAQRARLGSTHGGSSVVRRVVQDSPVATLRFDVARLRTVVIVVVSDGSA